MDLMAKLTVELGQRSYPIHISRDFASMARTFEDAGLGHKILVVTDKNVDGYLSSGCIEALRTGGFDVRKFVMGVGEESKNLDTVRDIYRFALDCRLERDSTIAALGGGVVGDVAGFAAATLLRGVNFVQLPTSLLAQADSSVGGKVGVNFDGAKNMVGAFYQPRLVYMNVGALKTLPPREMRSGLAEVIKHAVIRDAGLFEEIEEKLEKILACDEDILIKTLKANCAIKSKVVEQDERESGPRADLNFGHTIGPALESAYGFKFTHGECVALGMLGAFKLANRLGMASGEDGERVKSLLERAGLPVSLTGVDADKVYGYLLSDKKIKKGKLTFVLPRKIGEVTRLTLENESLIKSAIGELGE